MKDYTRTALEADRPSWDGMESISFCLEQLYKDKTKTIVNEVCRGLTYEELIGALLVARDELKRLADDLYDEETSGYK